MQSGCRRHTRNTTPHTPNPSPPAWPTAPHGPAESRQRPPQTPTPAWPIPTTAALTHHPTSLPGPAPVRHSPARCAPPRVLPAPSQLSPPPWIPTRPPDCDTARSPRAHRRSSICTQRSNRPTKRRPLPETGSPRDRRRRRPFLGPRSSRPRSPIPSPAGPQPAPGPARPAALPGLGQHVRSRSMRQVVSHQSR